MIAVRKWVLKNKSKLSYVQNIQIYIDFENNGIKLAY